MINITCYGQTKQYKTKQQAIQFFIDCLSACDPASSEAGRYMYIIQALINNETNITDEDY